MFQKIFRKSKIHLHFLLESFIMGLRMQNRLILFDLDDTLVNFLEYYQIAFTEAFKEVYGIQSDLKEIDFAGKTIPNIIREMGELKGIDKNTLENDLEIALDAISNIFFKSISNSNEIKIRNILPGAREILEKLSSLDYPIGLLTGSTGKIARKILEVTDLKKYFDILTFGEEADDREGLFNLSLERAEKKFNIKFRGSEIVMIGDSIRDVDCGKKFSAITIAVTTGHHSYEKLKRLKPDYILDDLGEIERVIKAINQKKF
ncbi:hypothetical protein AC481_01475 [miscellaneous Crenarchaeota group archaeon SMTZ-80]|nr:MAG: hypothetical protein AC481_01475 [miscellaneous Crenarchaeota group archaeon SMTZ-80]